MGFHIKIDTSSERMLRTLKTSPEDIFQRRYHCYLLFLVGASDDEAMDWLIKNVVSLDSLTGAEIAFGIFMKSLKISLEIDSEPIRGLPRVAASIPAEGFKGDYSIERIIKNHIYERVYNRDEVMAVTYATDIVAREFKVMDRLPCMLLLDPIPFGTIHVVQLTNVVCSHLIKIIRQSIHKYLIETQDKPIAFSYTSAILDAQNNLEQWENEEETFKKRIEKIKNDLARLKGENSSETGASNIKDRLDSARLHFGNGAARKTKNAILGGSSKNKNTFKHGLNFEDNSMELVLSFIEKECPVIRRCVDTIDALTGYLKEDEITNLWMDRISLIHSKHIVPLLHLPEELKNDIDKGKIKIWIEEVENKKADLISKFQKLLPDIEMIENKIKEEYRRENKQLIDAAQFEFNKAQIEIADYKRNYEVKKRKLEDLLDESIRLYQKNDPITFSSIFVKEVKSLKMDGYLSQSKIAGGKFAENIFKPDTILKILDFINKLTG